MEYKHEYFKECKRPFKYNDEKFILSYGGGVNSSALFFYIIENKLPLDLVIFADPKNDEIETYIAVNNMIKECKKRNIPFKIVQSKYVTEFGSLREYYLHKKTVMSFQKRDCSTKFKVSPILSYLREKYGKKTLFRTYLGIAYDELERMKSPRVSYTSHLYLFVEDKIDRKGNQDILDKYKFKAVKSGCRGCLFKSEREWGKLLQQDPEEFNKWEELEKNNSRYPEITLRGKKETLQDFRIKNKTTLLQFLSNENLMGCDNGCWN